jgi:hypothetical protein
MRVTTVRQMTPYPSQGSVTQFRSTDCDWAFHVQQPFKQPFTPDVAFEFQRSYAGAGSRLMVASSRHEESMRRSDVIRSRTGEALRRKPKVAGS